VTVKSVLIWRAGLYRHCSCSDSDWGGSGFDAVREAARGQGRSRVRAPACRLCNHQLSAFYSRNGEIGGGKELRQKNEQ
jgi:hypothetical protein